MVVTRFRGCVPHGGGVRGSDVGFWFRCGYGGKDRF